MNIPQLRSLLEAAGYNSARYSIGHDWIKDSNGPAANLCITDGAFEVFVSERANRSNEAVFKTEDEATLHFLQIVMPNDYYREHWLGATMDDKKATALCDELKNCGIRRLTRETVRRGDKTYPWFSISVYGVDYGRSKPISEKYGLEWTFRRH